MLVWVHAGKHKRTHSRLHGVWQWQWSVSPVIIVLEDERSEVEEGAAERRREGDRRGGGKRRREKKLRGGYWLPSSWDADDCCSRKSHSADCFVFFSNLSVLFWDKLSGFSKKKTKKNLVVYDPCIKEAFQWIWKGICISSQIIDVPSHTFKKTQYLSVIKEGSSWFKAAPRISSFPYPH